MLAGALGKPRRLIITAGEAGDIAQTSALLEGQAEEGVLADKADDGNALRPVIAAIAADVAIPSDHYRKVAVPHDAIFYRHRNRIQRCFSTLGHVRRHDLATMNVDSAQGYPLTGRAGGGSMRTGAVNQTNCLRSSRPRSA